ncbi:LAFE_0H11628g1_1 [Lachancea fermentati]|uniref:LAFE_0H11628g1_1 n=1 Tax=Lachancea fermentati TaxID=4955 RepID=A0A1G4MKI8_LACFM|nr:LAFE_0H11628g1_1 [Lachancea fermentati]
MSEISVSEYISEQNALENEARELMPWDPKHCTYTDGSLRQPIYACLTCGNVGVCYSCSIQCHSQCELVELFSKRGFTCDCGTERQKKKSGEFWCQLRRNTVQDVCCLTNRYGHNFKGLFCDCNTQFDPDSDSAMLQCCLGLECNEDWYHDCCIVGSPATSVPTEINDCDKKLKDFPDLESFDVYICWKCISRHHAIFEHLLSHELSEQLIVKKLIHHELLDEIKTDNLISRSTGSKKRKGTDTYMPFSLFLSHDYSSILAKIKNSLEPTDRLYVFLSTIAPFLIDDDPIYQPPDDSDAASTYELGTQALCNSVDREIAINGILAMDNIKAKLSAFLKPFAEANEVVKEEDIRTFFQMQQEEHKRDNIK